MDTFPRWLKTVLVLAAIIMLTGVAWHYRKEQANVRDRAIASLEAITQLKAGRIAEWRAARLGEATVMMASRLYGQLAARWMETPPTPEEASSALSEFFLTIQRQYRYHNALFVSGAGRVYFHLNAQPQIDQLHEVSKNALASAFRTKSAVLTDLYSPSGDGHPQVDLILPFFANKGDSFIPSGAIIFQYDANQFLYPLIRFWPVQSRSAETLVVRREGDSVLFLNDLRHEKGTALTLRIPLTQKEDFAVKAVLVKGGVIQGKDYRHAEVLAVARSIPDTTWMVISKEDENEAFATLQWESILMLAMFAFLIASVSTALGILWQRKDKDHYRAMFEAEALRSKSEERYRNTLDSMMEGCHIIDFEWRYIYVNDAFARHSRRSKEELLGHTVMECFPDIENAGIFPALQSCMNERKPRLAESTLVAGPDGSKAWFEFSIQPSPEGIFVLTIDISQRKQVEESLRESEAKYRALFEHMTNR